LQHTEHIVLLVEDDADDVLLMRDAFAGKTNVKLVHEKNGYEALSYLKELKAKTALLPCLIIMDINMPKLNGKQLVSILKNDNDFQSIPMIVFTTSSNNSDKEFCSSFNVPMITKLFDMNSFGETAGLFLSYCQAG
jgi:CheY-like chemotaxis protein